MSRASATPATKVLHLRRRADGSLSLTNAAGSASSPDRAFPAVHVLTATWLFGPDGSRVARRVGDTVTVELSNARASYRVIGGDETRGLIECELVSSELFDPTGEEG